MATSEETRVLTQVSERLSHKYPQVPTQRVSEVVSATYHDFDHARIRDFVEILVERDAAELLNRSA